jgi:nickel-dependent lactate racemase
MAPRRPARAIPTAERPPSRLDDIMRVHLEYGRTGLDVELPDQNVVGCLQYRPLQPLAHPEAAVRQSLERPIGSPPLAELARGRRSACVAICDVTRPVPNAVLLPPILDVLEAAGVPRDEILILVATGLHRPNLGDELIEMVGPHVAANYRIENHHGQVRDEHTYLGQSPRGVPVWIDSRYVAAELKITTGLIEPHFMAGYSGGRKLICPGLAALETIRTWHGPSFLEHPNARNGCLDENPVHEENTAIGRMAGCDFIVNVVIGEGEKGPAANSTPTGPSHGNQEDEPHAHVQRPILHVVAGDMEAAFLDGVSFAQHAVTATLPGPVDIVVTSSAGYPLDATFYQAVKGMVAALPIVKPGGTIIVAASLSEGVGSPEFQRILDDYPTLDRFMERLLGHGNGQRKGDGPHLCEAPSGPFPQKGTVPFSLPECFVMDHWQLEELAKVRRRANVKVVSDGLPPETLRRMFVDSAASVEAAVADGLRQYGPRATVAVIPKGPYVLAELA